MMSDYEQALKQFLSRPAPIPHACGCMGPRDGDPLCPCAMKYCEKVNGKWYRIKERRANGKITFEVDLVPSLEEHFNEISPKKLSLKERLEEYKRSKAMMG